MIFTTWSQQSPATRPEPRQGHAMAYDASRNVVVMFGGDGLNNTLLDDTWEWNGADWTRIHPPPRSPWARAMHTMVYDSGLGKVLLFGGNSYQTNGIYYGAMNDIWEWDGAVWTDVSPPNVNLAPRYTHGMAYDAGRQRTVIFGGRASNATWVNDTWEWDSGRQLWTEVRPNAYPPIRINHTMAYDAVANSGSGYMMLLGGLTGNWGVAHLRDKHLQYDGTGWGSDPSTNGHPTADGSIALASDLTRGYIMAFGGSTSGGVSDETWFWDGHSGKQTWNRVTGLTSQPSGRVTQMAYDSQNQTYVIFGGNANGSVMDDTWTLATGGGED